MINPATTRLFHITAIENVDAIVAAGGLHAKNALQTHGVNYTNIAFQTIQDRHASKLVSAGRGGLLHDYVPFYFAPRSPMLYTINQGNTRFEAKQEGIVTLETTVSEATAHDPSGFIIYEMNASLAYSTAYATLADLDKIAWDLLWESPTMDGFCAYWRSQTSPVHHEQRMEKRQAEFLVHQRVPLSAITCIGVANEVAAAKLRQLLIDSPLRTLIAVRSAWYY